MSNKDVVLHAIGKTKVISIIRGIESRDILEVISSLYAGGIRCLEITMNTPGALAMITEARASKDILVGAGTVLSVDDAKRAIDAGAQFVLAPCLNVEVIKCCLDRDVLPIPGIFTPTEMLLAHNSGAELLKIFPAGSVGPQFIKDLLGSFCRYEAPSCWWGIPREHSGLHTGRSLCCGSGFFPSKPILGKEKGFYDHSPEGRTVYCPGTHKIISCLA